MAKDTLDKKSLDDIKRSLRTINSRNKSKSLESLIESFIANRSKYSLNNEILEIKTGPRISKKDREARKKAMSIVAPLIVIEAWDIYCMVKKKYGNAIPISFLEGGGYGITMPFTSRSEALLYVNYTISKIEKGKVADLTELYRNVENMRMERQTQQTRQAQQTQQIIPVPPAPEPHAEKPSHTI